MISRRRKVCRNSLWWLRLFNMNHVRIVSVLSLWGSWSIILNYVTKSILCWYLRENHPPNHSNYTNYNKIIHFLAINKPNVPNARPNYLPFCCKDMYQNASFRLLAHRLCHLQWLLIKEIERNSKRGGLILTLRKRSKLYCLRLRGRLDRLGPKK